jgi:hypothetical protein
MKTKIRTILAICMVAICIISCSNSDDVKNLTNEQLILGKWKLTKQISEGFVSDYTNNTDETTHQYFENGTLIFHEWGETFNLTYMVSGNSIFHIEENKDMFEYRIISIDDKEMVLELISSNNKIRYYKKIG